MSTISCCNFYLVVSITDLFTWFGDDENDYSENENIKNILTTLCTAVDLREIYNFYFEETSVGTGDVYLYQSSKNSKNIFAINLYRSLTDQLDLISFSVQCDEQHSPVIRAELRSFFNEAVYQIHYEESHHSSHLHKMIDIKSYPRTIEESGFQQKIIIITCK